MPVAGAPVESKSCPWSFRVSGTLAQDRPGRAATSGATQRASRIFRVIYFPPRTPCPTAKLVLVEGPGPSGEPCPNALLSFQLVDVDWVTVAPPPVKAKRLAP